MNTEKTSKGVKKYSLWILISFQFGQLVANMFTYIFSAQTQYYYEKVVLLDISLFTLAYIIYTIWNMFNDPLVGYLCDRSTRWTKKYGKRSPFILLFGIPWAIAFMFVFAAPSVAILGQIGVFIWLLLIIILLDTFASGWEINHFSLFPDKFRDDSERKKSGGVFVILATVGLMFGAIVPSLIVPLLGEAQGYSAMGIIIGTIGITFILASIPGNKEDLEMREKRAKIDEERTSQFFSGMKSALRHKNFRILVIFNLFYFIYYAIVVASIPYWIDDMLGLPKSMELGIMIVLILVQPLTAPIWYKISLKIGSKKILVYGNFIIGIGLLLMILVPYGPTGFPVTIAFVLIIAIGGGGRLTASYPIWSDVIDEATLINRERQEGLYQGVNTFFSRLAIALQVIVFFFIHTLTGYEPTASQQSPEALLGLRFQFSLIPAIIMISASLIFWKMYDITSEKARNIKEQLIKDNL